MNVFLQKAKWDDASNTVEKMPESTNYARLFGLWFIILDNDKFVNTIIEHSDKISKIINDVCVITYKTYNASELKYINYILSKKTNCLFIKTYNTTSNGKLLFSIIPMEDAKKLKQTNRKICKKLTFAE